MPIKVVCAWCGKRLPDKEGELTGELKGHVSHGICDDCTNKMREQDKKDLGKSIRFKSACNLKKIAIKQKIKDNDEFLPKNIIKEYSVKMYGLNQTFNMFLMQAETFLNWPDKIDMSIEENAKTVGILLNKLTQTLPLAQSFIVDWAKLKASLPDYAMKPAVFSAFASDAQNYAEDLKVAIGNAKKYIMRLNFLLKKNQFGKFTTSCNLKKLSRR